MILYAWEINEEEIQTRHPTPPNNPIYETQGSLLHALGVSNGHVT